MAGTHFFGFILEGNNPSQISEQIMLQAQA